MDPERVIRFHEALERTFVRENRRLERAAPFHKQRQECTDTALNRHAERKKASQGQNRMRPHDCECRMCIMARWRQANLYRKKKAGLPPLPRPQVPPARQGRWRKEARCQCRLCVYNRAALKLREQRRKADRELDRKALERWPAEWGARA